MRFFFSRIVFQHNPPPLIGKLIKNALQSLCPGGVAIFQVPTYGNGYSFSVKEYLAIRSRLDMEMHCIPQSEIFAIIAQEGCQSVELREDDAIGRRGTWISNMFVVRRP